MILWQRSQTLRPAAYTYGAQRATLRAANFKRLEDKK